MLAPRSPTLETIKKWHFRARDKRNRQSRDARTTRLVALLTAASPWYQLSLLRQAFLRFSTVAGERGATDAERDVRGFALCLYTEEGNWDIVGNDTPVFPPATQLRHYHVHSHHVELGSAFLPQCGTIWLNQVPQPWLNQVPQRGPSWRPN
jgi:hypothetical protein